jgi:cold-inducible RNA-binding protein
LLSEAIKKGRIGMPKLFIGNIPFSYSADDIRNWFETHGYQVARVDIIQDKHSGQSRGYGFVELRDASQVTAAIQVLNKRKLAGHKLTINVATPMGSNRVPAS